MNRQQILLDMGLGPIWQARKTALKTSADEATVIKEPLRASHAHVPDLAALQNIVHNCQACELHQTRQQPLFGEGNPNPTILLVSDAPSPEEDASAQVMMGAQGRLLHNMLLTLRITPEHAYWCYASKCSPHALSLDERHLQACSQHLHHQIKFLQPKLIITLGHKAAYSLLQQPIDLNTPATYHTTDQTPVLCIAHPQALLQNPQQKAQAWQTLKHAYTLLNLKGASL